MGSWWQLAALLAALAVPRSAGAGSVGSVHGTVALAVEGARLADAGPVVVYLDALEGQLDYPIPREVPRLSQKNATFSPPFLVVAVGQTVEMPNDDSIFHNVFSYSKPNEMDLGLYPKGESRAVTFHHPGAVRVYCSIHESMSAVVFVAPSPYHTLADARGAFTIRGVPPGRYRLRTWSQMLPEAAREVEVGSGGDVAANLAIEGRGWGG